MAIIEVPAEAAPSGARIDKLFRIMVRQEASDLHLKQGRPPILRIKGMLQPLKSDPLTDAQIAKLVSELFSEDQAAQFKEQGSLDLAHEFDDGWRVRINVYHQRGHLSVACRLVQKEIPTYEQLHLPPQISKIPEIHQGLVIITGATGTGKSTTLAAMVQQINENRRCHILTVEDPIEYSYTDEKAYINQREIGIDGPDWLSALKFAMREDPDVILIGEMRDPETFQAGLSAAETGHLVFGSMHAADCRQVFGRIMEMFPTEKHSMIRQSLAANLRAILAQLLIPAAKEGVHMVPAVEIMFANSFVRALIMRGEDDKISDVIQGGGQEGMQDITQALADLVQKDWVLRRVALDYAPNKDRLQMVLRGISTGGGGQIIG